MMIKAGAWRRLTFLQKRDLLVFHASQTEAGRAYLKNQEEIRKQRRHKNKPLRAEA